MTKRRSDSTNFQCYKDTTEFLNELVLTSLLSAWLKFCMLCCLFLFFNSFSFLKGPPAPKYHAPSNQFSKASAPSAMKTPGGSQAKVVPIASLNPYQSK